ncbi:unnamed protein product [Adineta ricciae]|uniref:GH18 domain-containing protein n=1 Tax=Adineta ricciae TaxID=249248 RepID=A0A815RIE0_ADIRI|nr:unnamed protein product [Adineta ricciae]CAF1476305.1 unnamed protein product [Adineta ricciae]
MLTPTIIVAYYTAWSIYSRAFFIADIPGDKITHINYAFANIGSDGRIALGDPWADVEKTFGDDTWDQPLRGNFNQLIKLKEKYPHLRTLISVGGWTWSGRFSDIALTRASRENFAQSCVEFIRKYSFDGVDIDWEYPVSGGLPGNTRRPIDKQNYVLLLKEIREKLDIAGRIDRTTYLLTVATGASTERILDMDLRGMSTYLDWINIMAYDFHGGWEAKTGHNAPLFRNDAETTTDVAPSFIKSRYNCHGAIQGYIAAGAPRSKLVLGLGLYGRGWQGVKKTDMNGFSQPASLQPPSGTWENGVFDYDHLKKSYVLTYTRHWDNQSKVPYLYNSTTGIWISYDDHQSIAIKADYIKREKLAGAMFWELSGDRDYDLIGVAHKVLHNGKKPSSECHPPVETNSSSVQIFSKIQKPVVEPSHVKTINSKAPLWETKKEYNVNDLVIFENELYRCRQRHMSLPGWTPLVVAALWLRI